MNITILKDKASINAALATMHPVACEATKVMAHNLIDAPHKLDDSEAIRQELLQCCTFACARAGINPNTNRDKFEDFIENHAQAILNVSLSLVAQTAKRKKWGRLGAAAAFTGGIVLGSIFG